MPAVQTVRMTTQSPKLSSDQRHAIGQRLKQARIRAGHPSATAATRACGFVANTYRSNENGTRAPSVALLMVYADAFGVSADWLLGREPVRGLGGGVRRWLDQVQFLDRQVKYIDGQLSIYIHAKRSIP